METYEEEDDFDYENHFDVVVKCSKCCREVSMGTWVLAKKCDCGEWVSNPIEIPQSHESR